MTPARVAGLRFTETMRGYFARGAEDDFGEAWRRGRRENSPFRFTLTIAAPDLEAMLADEQHEAEITGTVTAPALDERPLRVRRGRFHLFVRDKECSRTRRMVYRLWLESEAGARYFFDGYKLIHDDPGIDLWYDTTALFVTVYEGDSDSGGVVGRGILRIWLRDFGPQLLSMRVTGGVGWVARCGALLRFLYFFASVLAEVYVWGKFRRASDRSLPAGETGRGGTADTPPPFRDE